MPSQNHSLVQANMIGEFMKERAFRVHSELTLDIDGERATPDISLYPRSRPVSLRADVDRPSDPPLLAVEIVSPHQGMQGMQDVLDKVAVYFRHGVKSCWVVVPPMSYVEILTPDGGVRRYTEGTATDPVLGLSVELAAIFSCD